MTMYLSASHRIGQHLLVGDGVYRIISRWQSLSCLPGGNGVCQFTLIQVREGFATRRELSRLDSGSDDDTCEC